MNLTLILKKEWFEKIATGLKTIEYREAKKYWKTRLEDKKFDMIIFKNGYTKNSPVIIKKWIKTEKLNTGIDTDIKINLPAYAIHFEDLL